MTHYRDTLPYHTRTPIIRETLPFNPLFTTTIPPTHSNHVCLFLCSCQNFWCKKKTSEHFSRWSWQQWQEFSSPSFKTIDVRQRWRARGQCLFCGYMLHVKTVFHCIARHMLSVSFVPVAQHNSCLTVFTVVFVFFSLFSLTRIRRLFQPLVSKWKDFGKAI